MLLLMNGGRKTQTHTQESGNEEQNKNPQT